MATHFTGLLCNKLGLFAGRAAGRPTTKSGSRPVPSPDGPPYALRQQALARAAVGFGRERAARPSRATPGPRRM